MLCLASGAGKALPPAPDVKATPREPDPVLKDFPGKAAAPKIGLPSASDDFAALRGAFAWRSDLGYRVCSAENGSGYALKKLPEPVTGKATFRLKVNFTVATEPTRPRRNGFFVFGSSADTSKLILCAVYQKQKKASIMDGTKKGIDRADQRLSIDLAKELEMVVTVDVASRQVSMTIGGKQVTLDLKRDLKRISYIGYCVQGAVCDFGPVVIAPGPSAESALYTSPGQRPGSMERAI